jgi:hypothetical protein
MAFLRNEGFFVFLYEKVVVILQWISRETEKSVVFDMVEKINKIVNILVYSVHLSEGAVERLDENS